MAGKSTLMKCLFGIYHMDAGEIYIDGEKVEIKDPDDAMEKGIAMVHQLAYLQVLLQRIWSGRLRTQYGLLGHITRQ